MSELFDFQDKMEKTSHLKLVVSNPPFVQRKSPPKATNFDTGFTAEVHDRGYPYHTLLARDPFHCLECELELEIYDNGNEEGEPRTAVCHFPNILSEELDEVVEEDELLYGMILVQFQMKLLKQILLFCGEHKVLNLLIDVEDTPQGHALKIYEKLATHKNKVLTTTGTKVQLCIPTTQKAFDKWVDFMKKINQKFRKALWEDYHANSAIRNYLISNPCLEFFG